MNHIIGNIPKRWKQLSGSEKWAGLLDPIDNDLRRYIIHYGERAQATYDTFNTQRESRYAGTSRYSRANLFTRVGLDTPQHPFKYRVVKYIYATSDLGLPESFIVRPLCDDRDCKESNWIGYVAVATDEGKDALGRRDILVAWRGTIRVLEWFKDFDFPLVDAGELFREEEESVSGRVKVRVHQGWLSIYTSADEKSGYVKKSAREQVTSVVMKLVNKYTVEKGEEVSVTVTGHSLGGSLGVLNAADIAHNKFNRPNRNGKKTVTVPVTAFVFGCPHVGDDGFERVVKRAETDQLRVLRVRNRRDIIPVLPPGLKYEDVGEELVVDSSKSTYLKKGVETVWTCHNLEVYMHMVAGWRGDEGRFEFGEVKRDVALVNKISDALKEKLMVPGYWWCEKNRGMVQVEDGSWVLRDHEEDDHNQTDDD